MKSDTNPVELPMIEHTARSLTRRGFFAASAAAGLAATSPAAASPPLGTALIGCGAAGSSVARAVARGGTGLGLVAVTDIDEPRMRHLAGLTGARATSCWEAMVARADVEAIILATPDDCHATMAAACLAAGKHVYVVPPLARTADEVRALRVRALAGDRVLHVGMDPTQAAFWREICRHDARAGGQRWIHVDCPHDTAAANDWLRDPARSLGVAARDAFNVLYPLQHHLRLGAPLGMTALGGTFAPEAGDVPDALAITARYRGGVTVVLSCKGQTKLPDTTTVRGDGVSLALPVPAASGAVPAGDLLLFARAIAGDESARHRIDDACTAQAALCDALAHCLAPRQPQIA